MSHINVDQEETELRLKLSSVASALKKLANILLHSESKALSFLIEPQIVNRFLVLANQITSLSSLKESEGETFVSFLKDATNIIQSMGNIPKAQNENESAEITKALKGMKNLADQIEDLLPIVISIDNKRKRVDYETFGGLLQRLIDATQEKRHMMLRGVK